MKKALSKPIIAIGLVSFLINTSSMVVYVLTPLYLTEVLGITALSLGVLEGIVEMLAWSSRLFSGVVADYFQKRKPILILAYIAIAISRPLFAISNSISFFFSAKSIDRISNGLQATARDSLIGDLAGSGQRGAAYGLKKSLAFTGSMLGAVLTFIVLHYYELSYQNTFLLATIPAVFAVVVLMLFVKDTNKKQMTRKISSIIKPIRLLFTGHNDYWKIILLAVLFNLGNYSGVFAILYAKHITQSNSIAPVLMIVQNLGGLLSAYPIGLYSDKGNRSKLLGYGFLLAILSNLCFTFANNSITILIAALLWGSQMGITQSLFPAKIAGSTHSDLRGSAFGLYYLIMGVMLLLSNTMIGWAFDNLAHGIAFYISSIFMLLAFLTLTFERKIRN